MGRPAMTSGPYSIGSEVWPGVSKVTPHTVWQPGLWVPGARVARLGPLEEA